MCEMFPMKPIGTMRTVFHFKNGTPRQSALCQAARGTLTIDKSIFNNPEHSLEGLQQFSHAWIIFVFHKNNNVHTKAKVKPPRLDGRRVGVFSTRSPYRPNNIGLSLVKIDRVQGSSVHFSGIDLLDGTPVLDIKPYIPDYDEPKNSFSFVDSGDKQNEVLKSDSEVNSSEDYTADCSRHDSTKVQEITMNVSGSTGHDNISVSGSTGHDNISVSGSTGHDNIRTESDGKEIYTDLTIREEFVQRIVTDRSIQPVTDNDIQPVTDSNIQHVTDNDIQHVTDSNIQHVTDNDIQHVTDSNNTSFTKWNLSDKHESTITECNVTSKQTNVPIDLGQTRMCPGEVIHTTSTETIPSVVAPWLLAPPVVKLKITFTHDALGQLNRFSRQASDPHYRLDMFTDADEARRSIAEIIQEDPRSVYRRQHCQDNLYYLALDVLHVTCWFDEDKAQVVRVKPVALVPKLNEMSVDAKGQGH